MKLYTARSPISIWLDTFITDDLKELWNNCQNNLNLAYDDEVYEALKVKGYFK